jgi:Secretion system C-terminal sorting domain
MKICLLFFIIMLDLLSLDAQSEWNYIVPIASPFETYKMKVDRTTDKILLCSIGFDTLDQQCIIYTVLDTLGNVEKINYVVDSLGVRSSYDLWYGGMISTSDGGSLTTFTTKRRNNTVLKLDQQLEKEFLVEFQRDTLIEFSNFDMTAHETTKGYALVGSFGLVGQSYSNGQIRFIGFDGQELWHTKFDHAPFGDRVLDIIELNDSTLLAGTVESLTSNSPIVQQVGRTGFYTINAKTGQILTSWQTEASPELGYMRKLMLLDDSTILMFSIVPRGFVGTNTLLVRNTLTVMNLDYEVIRRDSIGGLTGLGSWFEIEGWRRTNDGAVIVAAGDINADSTRLCGRVFRFDPYTLQADWSVKLFAPLVPSDYERSKLYDLDTLTSGNIIAVGTSRDTFTIHTWVVKVTKDGCVDTLWCNTSSTMHPNMLTEGAQLVVYPNPASDWVQVGWPDAQNNHEAELMIYDALGRIRLQTRVKNLDRINLKFMPSGMYFMLVNRNGNYTTAKLMIDK